MKGLEPSTFSLEGGERPLEAMESQEVSDGSSDACTNACTDDAESGQSDDAGDDFAEAMAMVARLPLTDDERAEAVRRLLEAKGGDRG